MRNLPWNDDLAATVAALRALAPPPAEVQAAAAAIVADVRARGDEAVREQTARLDRVELAEDYAVPVEEMAARLAALSPGLRAALEIAAANIRAYHEHEAVAPWRETWPRARSSVSRSCRWPPPASTFPAASPTTRRRCS